MAFEEHKKAKFQFGNPYADYEYYNKNSRKTGPGLILSLLFGVGMLILAWFRWQALAAAEETGGTVKLTSLEWGLYKVGGKLGLIGIFLFLAGFFIYNGIKNYQRLEKIRRS